MISEFTDSRRWWDCDKEEHFEWTYEGKLKTDDSQSVSRGDELPCVNR